MRALVVVLLCSTACSWSSKVKKDVVETEHAEAQIVIDETKIKTQDETKIDTKTVREENAVIVVEPNGTFEIVRVPKKGALKLPPGAKIQGTVPLSTTTIDQAKVIGAKAETDKLKGTGEQLVDRKMVDKTQTAKKTGPSIQVYLIAISVVLILVAAAYLYFRYSTPRA